MAETTQYCKHLFNVFKFKNRRKEIIVGKENWKNKWMKEWVKYDVQGPVPISQAYPDVQWPVPISQAYPDVQWPVLISQVYPFCLPASFPHQLHQSSHTLLHSVLHLLTSLLLVMMGKEVRWMTQALWCSLGLILTFNGRSGELSASSNPGSSAVIKRLVGCQEQTMLMVWIPGRSELDGEDFYHVTHSRRAIDNLFSLLLEFSI